MKAALFSTKDIPLKEIGALLRREGVTVSEYILNCDDTQVEVTGASAILIFEQHGAAEFTEKVWRLLGPDGELTLCCPSQSSQNYELLESLGTKKFVTPQSWTSFHIAERILGELLAEEDRQMSRLGRLYGGSRIMKELYTEIQTVAPLSDPILILGETGTGKDLVAREIHEASGRGGKFIALNCSEFSPEIIESELFGHARGSFTGAAAARKGLLLESGAGTVFLDEIGELSVQLQSKLLRVIEDRKVRPVGANDWIDIKARFVLATNRNIQDEVVAGKFRQDLFERISAFVLLLAPLRERMADVPLLFDVFLDEYCEEYGTEIKVPEGCRDALFNYDWKGNVRELRALVRNLASHPTTVDGQRFVSPLRFAEITSKRRIGQRPTNVVEFDPATETLDQVTSRVESQYLTLLLQLTANNKDRAISLSGMSRSTFYEKMKHYFGS